jgi:hypothetical protein
LQILGVKIQISLILTKKFISAKLLFVQTGPVIAEEIFKYISVKIGPISTFSKKSPMLRISPKTTTKYQTIIII